MTSSTKVIERGIEMSRETGVGRRGEVEARGEAGSEETTTDAAVLVVRMPLLSLSHRGRPHHDAGLWPTLRE